MKEAIGFAQCQAECDSLGERGNRKSPVIGAQVLKFQHTSRESTPRTLGIRETGTVDKVWIKLPRGRAFKTGTKFA